jgi:hypothetical protein
MRLVSAFICQILSLLALACMSFSLAYGQETRGTIQGTVRDSSGAVVPGSAVAVVNIDTNVSLKATTNPEGNYNVPFLLPGRYNVSVTAQGFKTSTRESLELRIADRLQVDYALEVGDLADRVVVSAEAPLLQTATANLGLVIDSKRLSNLPLAHGSPFNLVFLGGGTLVASGYARTWQETSNLDGISDYFSFNGTPTATSDWTIDGSPNVQSSHGTGPANSPPADIVQEFKLETAFDASVGHTSGTVVNVSIKAGTNSPHGTAYGFFRKPEWDANTFFGNRIGAAKPTYAYKRWGASLTGPVYIPKVYHGRDRTFFAYAYEGVHRSEAYGFTNTTVDPKFATGDFSSLLGISPQYQIYDPATIQAAAGGRFSIQPFAGNIIPAARISPIAQKFLEHYPKPNTTGRADSVNNFDLPNISDPDIYYNHTARVDHTINDKQRIFGRITGMRRQAGPYRNYYDDPAVANNFIGRTKQITIDDVYMFSPSLIMNLRFGINRFRSGHSPRKLGYDPAQLGFSPDVTNLLSAKLGPMFPRVDVAGLMSIGTETPTNLNTDIYSGFASLNKQQGSHNLKFGSDIRANKGINGSFGQPGGRFIFGTDFTRGPLDNSPASPGSVGQGLAALLLGLPTGGLLDLNDTQAVTSTFWSLYLHDNWRVSRRLTVDIGLRWEYEGPVTERFNRSVRGFDASAGQAIEAQARAQYAARPDAALAVDQFRVRGGLLYAGVGDTPRLLWDRSWLNFAPRIGFAYQLVPDKVVARGGFGVYPISIGQPTQNYAILSGFSISTDLIPTLNNGQSFQATLANPFPGGLLAAPGSSLGAASFLGRGLSFYNPIGRTPYSMHWNYNTQVMLPGEFLLEAGYSGSRSLKLRTPREINGVPNQYLSTSPTRDQERINFLTANVANPFAGLLPGTALNGATIARNQLLKPYPQFPNIVMLDYQGYSWYNSLQMRLERRYSKGLTIQASYSYSRKMDAVEYLNAADAAPSEFISPFDRPHLITFSGLYELPIGKGKAVGANFHRAMEALLGGWQLGAVWQLNSGPPVPFSGNVIYRGDYNDIALPAGQRRPERWFNTDGFERSAANALSWNLRTFPPRLAEVRSGRHNGLDLSLLKSFRFYEQHQFQFRGEFFNAFNHPTAFFAPNSDPYSSAFGTVTGMFGLPRQIQFGLKYIF